MRSRLHMLTVAAARLREDGASPKLIEAVEEFAKLDAARLVRGEVRNREFEAEQKRISRQRNFFTFLPPSQAKDDLKASMLQRAYDLMWEGFCTETDAIVEFLPSADVDRMFQAWESDQEGAKPKSAFYGGKP